ncbi:MAG TPA: zinc protease, partial [Porphyromonadaceae bacterium]|nr:zinc protease [Porphyromonadaceae bacterium]
MYEYNDKELGKIIVKPDTRAKRIIARRKGEYIQLTVPFGFTPKRLPSLLDDMRHR